MEGHTCEQWHGGKADARKNRPWETCETEGAHVEDACVEGHSHGKKVQTMILKR